MTKIDDFAIDKLIELFGEEQIKEALSGDLTQYQTDPVGFLSNVLKIEHIPSKIVEMAESVRDNRVTIAQSCTGFGKTFFSAALALWMYKCFPDSQVILTSAPPELNLVEKLWQELVNFIFKNKKLFKSDKILALKVTDNLSLKEDEEGDCDKSPRHVIIGRTIPTSGDTESRKSRFSGFHQQNQLFVCDEGDAIGDEIYEAIDGCMSGSFSRLLVIFNPKRKSGAVWEKIRNNDSNVIVLSAFDHPNIIERREVIPGGAVSFEQTVQRINLWTVPLREDEEPDSNCFLVPDFLVGSVVKGDNGKELPPLEAGYRRIVKSQFSYIVMGTYPSTTENSLFDEVDINNAVTRWRLYKAQYGSKVTEGIRPVIGADIADEGADNCCLARRYGHFIDEFRPGHDIWRGIDVDLSADKIGKAYAEMDAMQVNVEADGIGAAIPPKIGRMFYWKCLNPECKDIGKTYSDQNVFKCPTCQKEMARQHFNVKKVYVSAPSDKKCDIGKFGTVRDELAWKVSEWLKKEPSSMIPDDPELIEQMLAYEYGEDQNSGKIKVSDKKTVKKKIRGSSDDKFAALRQCFYEQTIPRIRVI